MAVLTNQDRVTDELKTLEVLALCAGAYLLLSILVSKKKHKTEKHNRNPMAE